MGVPRHNVFVLLEFHMFFHRCTTVFYLCTIVCVSIGVLCMVCVHVQFCFSHKSDPHLWLKTWSVDLLLLRPEQKYHCVIFHSVNSLISSDHLSRQPFKMLRHIMPGTDLAGGTFGLGHRGPGAAMPPRSAPTSWGRHGSGARDTTAANAAFGGSMGITPPGSVSPRRRLRDERDQEERDTSRERDRQAQRMGPQRAMEVDDDIGKLMTRVVTVEAMLRQHAHQIAAQDKAIYRCEVMPSKTQ